MYGYEATHGYGYLFVTGGGGSADDSITHDKKWLLLFQNGFEQSSCAKIMSPVMPRCPSPEYAHMTCSWELWLLKNRYTPCTLKCSDRLEPLVHKQPSVLTLCYSSYLCLLLIVDIFCCMCWFFLKIVPVDSNGINRRMAMEGNQIMASHQLRMIGVRLIL